AGTGIGTFNDRVRDAVRGGNPFTAITDQGFASGLLTDPNEAASEIGALSQKNRLLAAQDLIRLSLAGNLKTFNLRDASGSTKSGEQLSYNGDPGAGYTTQPQESINYVSAHDNMTLFDAIQVKAKAEDDLATRIRYNNLALAVVLLSQGVPFFHAGDEILRSKSGDTDSYNSGDWFNRIDWTLQTHVWGSGLPPQDKNGSNWNTLRPLLGKASIIPAKADMEFAMGVFTDFLKIRKAEPGLRLATAQAIQDQVKFYDTGATQSLGLIVEKISTGTDGTESEGDLVVLFNGTPDARSWQDTGYTGLNYQLHPIQAGGTDPVVKEAAFRPLTGKFEVPARSAVVFRNMGGTVDTQPPPQVPTCACSTSGTNAALGMAALALLTLWRRRRGAARRQPILSRY
ncbi:MAG TPA: alpha-1,6-glucosidase domain-containing protein, partial [Myxococcaceae bacterium]